jgi:O-antigen/teichoic acid export membrane protein
VLGLLAGAAATLLPAVPVLESGDRDRRPGGAGGEHAAASTRADLRRGLAYGRHFAPVSLAATLVLLDTVLVGAVAGDTEAGHYGMGSRLLGPLVVLTAALCTALVPAVARGAGIRRAFLVVTGLTLTLIAVVVAAAPTLVRLAAGPGYQDAVPAIRVYALVAGLAAIAQPVVSWLQARGDERWVGRVLPAGIVAGLTGTGIGAALGGAVGGAAGQVAVSAGLCLLLAARFGSVRPR